MQFEAPGRALVDHIGAAVEAHQQLAAEHGAEVAPPLEPELYAGGDEQPAGGLAQGLEHA